MKSFTMPSANGKGAVLIEKILDEELGDKCGLYARVTIPAGSVLGYHEHHGNGESYFILKGTGVYDDNLQPEEVYYHPSEIECKVKWDTQRSWNLTQTPRFRQKPAKITKQKPDKEKQLRNRNIERARQLGKEYINGAQRVM